MNILIRAAQAILRNAGYPCCSVNATKPVQTVAEQKIEEKPPEKKLEIKLDIVKENVSIKDENKEKVVMSNTEEQGWKQEAEQYNPSADIANLKAENKRLSEAVNRLEAELVNQINIYNKHISGLHVQRIG